MSIDIHLPSGDLAGHLPFIHRVLDASEARIKEKLKNFNINNKLIFQTSDIQRHLASNLAELVLSRLK